MKKTTHKVSTITTLITCLALSFPYAAVGQTNDDTEEVILSESGGDYENNYTLDLSIPTVPALVLAGATAFEDVGHNFGSDIAMHFAATGDKPTVAISMRPYFLASANTFFKDMISIRDLVKNKDKSGLLSFLKRTQISAAIATVEDGDVTVPTAAIGFLFYPLNGTDPRRDKEYAKCLTDEKRYIFSTDKDFEKATKTLDQIKINTVLRGLGVTSHFPWTKADAGKFININQIAPQIFTWAGNQNPKIVIRDKGGKDKITRKQLIEYLNEQIQDETSKIIPAKAKEFQKHQETCINEAKARYANKVDLNFGFGLAAKSKDTSYDRLRSTGLSAWATLKLPIGKQLVKPEGDQNKKAEDMPFMHVIAGARFIESDQVAIDKDTQEAAETWIAGLTANLERDQFAFKFGGSYNHRSFKNPAIANEDFWRISAGVDYKISRDIQIFVEGGELIGDRAFGEGTFIRTGFKVNGDLASLMGIGK